MLRTSLYLASLLALTLSACRYDLDDIFQAGEVLDVPDADVGPPIDNLADLLRGGKFSTVDDACHTCAVRRCKDVSDACLEDAECVAFNRCIVQSTDPATQAECRAESVDWLSQDIPGRDVGGPYQQCVFQDRCSEECKARTNFQCVGKFSWPTTPNQTIPYRVRFVEALGQGKVVSGMEVKVCRPDDPPCGQPTATMMTDANGEVMLDLRVALRAFRGYLELKKEGIYPTLVRLGWPIAQEGVTNITIIDSTSVQLNVAAAGVQPDPERGLLQVRFFSCAGLTAPGISFTTDLEDEESLYWYANEIGLPRFDGTATSNIGAGGVINAVEGVHTLVAKQVATGTKTAETSAPVRGGYMTIVLFSPLDSN